MDRTLPITLTPRIHTTLTSWNWSLIPSESTPYMRRTCPRQCLCWPDLPLCGQQTPSVKRVDQSACSTVGCIQPRRFSARHLWVGIIFSALLRSWGCWPSGSASVADPGPGGSDHEGCAWPSPWRPPGSLPMIHHTYGDRSRAPLPDHTSSPGSPRLASEPYRIPHFLQYGRGMRVWTLEKPHSAIWTRVKPGEIRHAHRTHWLALYPPES